MELPHKRASREYHGHRWIEEGVKVRFDPFGSIQFSGSMDIKGGIVTGTVVYVNRKHKWFSVEYGNGLRTSFKFSDVGYEVNVCG